VATQPIFHDPPYFTLIATGAQPPSLKYPVAHAEETGHGCAICQSVAYAEADQVNIVLPSVPASLEVMVRAYGSAGESRYVPGEDALRALVLSGRARWRLPEGAPTPTRVVISYGFEQGNAMVSEERPAPPVDDSLTPLPPPAAAAAPGDDRSGDG
jgi:hypothetical protein